MPAPYAELFKTLSLHPVLWMVLALFSSTVAFKALCRRNFSVQLLRIAFSLEIFSAYGSICTSLHGTSYSCGQQSSSSSLTPAPLPGSGIGGNGRADLCPRRLQSCDLDTKRSQSKKSRGHFTITRPNEEGPDRTSPLALLR